MQNRSTQGYIPQELDHHQQYRDLVSMHNQGYTIIVHLEETVGEEGGEEEETKSPKDIKFLDYPSLPVTLLPGDQPDFDLKPNYLYSVSLKGENNGRIQVAIQTELGQIGKRDTDVPLLNERNR